MINFEYSSSRRIQQSDQFAYKKTSTATSDFNHPSEDYMNKSSTDLSAQMMSTQNNGKNRRCGR